MISHFILFNMLLIRSLNYMNFSFDESNQIFVITWHQASGDISPEEYKNSALVFKEVYSGFKGKPILHDMRNFQYIITPKEQEWIAEEIMADLVANYNLRRMAFILPEDLFAQTSTEQVSEEIKEAADDVFKSNFFDDPVKGLEWLLD